MTPQRVDFKSLVFSNLSFKLMALFIALVLWALMLGRKDAVLVRDINVEYLLSPKHQLMNDILKIVRVKVSGPRVGLKKFSQSEQSITIDLGDRPPGQQWIEVPTQGLALPLGVKVLSITPNMVKATIKGADK